MTQISIITRQNINSCRNIRHDLVVLARLGMRVPRLRWVQWVAVSPRLLQIAFIGIHIDTAGNVLKHRHGHVLRVPQDRGLGVTRVSESEREKEKEDEHSSLYFEQFKKLTPNHTDLRRHVELEYPSVHIRSWIGAVRSDKG